MLFENFHAFVHYFKRRFSFGILRSKMRLEEIVPTALILIEPDCTEIFGWLIGFRGLNLCLGAFTAVFVDSLHSFCICFFSTYDFFHVRDGLILQKILKFVTFFASKLCNYGMIIYSSNRSISAERV